MCLFNFHNKNSRDVRYDLCGVHHCTHRSVVCVVSESAESFSSELSEGDFLMTATEDPLRSWAELPVES